MSNNKLIEITLFVCTLLSGFYAGIGFFGKMGANPAIKLMSDHTFAEYWQHIDHFMAARMKIFGPILLFSLLGGTLILIKEYRTVSFWCMFLSFCISITDVAFTLSTNHPLNQIIQSWDLKNLPANVQEIKWRVINAFEIRNFFMIGSFAMVLLAVWFRKQNN